MKRWPILLLVLAVLAGAFYWFVARPRSTASTEVAYRTAAATRGEIVQAVTATGQLNPVTTVEVGTQVSGRIAQIYVDFNDPVKTGQLLAEIDPSTYEARVYQAEAELESARATYDLRKVNAARTAELRQSELVSQADYDEAMAQLRQQEAAMRIREAALQSAQLDLERTKILAPVDGVVISRDVNVGQTVQASFSAPKLFSIAQDLRQMEINASVSEADIGSVEAGQPVSFTVDAFPGRTFNGEVRQVRANSTVTQNVVTYATIITVDNEDLKLLPGMTASVVITTARRTNVIRLPNAALRFVPPPGALIRAATSSGGADNASGVAVTDLAQIPGFEQVPAEMRQRMFERFDQDRNGKLDATEVAAVEEARRRMAAGGNAARGGGGFSPGGGSAGGATAPARRAPPAVTHTVYVLAQKPAAGMPGRGELIPTIVRSGITDGAYTEILSGIEEGDIVAIGEWIPELAGAGDDQPRNPFMPSFGRGGQRGGR